jgi:two-component system sensor histidine kinase SenX3
MRRRKVDVEAREHIRRAFLCMAVCHELKQPLHSLNLNVELLSRRLGAAAETREIDAPIQAFGRVVERINDCLEAFSARTVPAPSEDQTVDLARLLAQVVDRARSGHPAARISVVGPALPPIPGSPEQLDYAFEALLENALHATPGSDEIILNVRSGDAEVIIDLIDHGVGMAPEVARHAFDIGFSTWGGEGVGLTLAKFITYHHSGGFSLTTKEGRGTTVSVVLPTTSEGGGGAVGT